MYVHKLYGRGKSIARIVTFPRITVILTSRIKLSFVNRPSFIKFCEQFSFKEKFKSEHSDCTVTVSQGRFQPNLCCYQFLFLGKSPKNHKKSKDLLIITLKNVNDNQTEGKKFGERNCWKFQLWKAQKKVKRHCNRNSEI